MGHIGLVRLSIRTIRIRFDSSAFKSNLNRGEFDSNDSIRSPRSIQQATCLAFGPVPFQHVVGWRWREMCASWLLKFLCSHAKLVGNSACEYILVWMGEEQRICVAEGNNKEKKKKKTRLLLLFLYADIPHPSSSHVQNPKNAAFFLFIVVPPTSCTRKFVRYGHHRWKEDWKVGSRLITNVTCIAPKTVWQVWTHTR